MERSSSNRNVLGDLAELASEWGDVARLLRRAYPHVRPDAEFEMALRNRLMGEATRLNASSHRDRRMALTWRAAVGVAAISVAGGGVALVLLRNRLGGFAAQGRPLAAHSN